MSHNIEDVDATLHYRVTGAVPFRVVVAVQVVNTNFFNVKRWNQLFSDKLTCKHVLFKDTFHVVNPSPKFMVQRQHLQ